MDLTTEISSGDRPIFNGDTDFRFADSFSIDQEGNHIICVRQKTPQGNRVSPLSEDQVYFDEGLQAYVVDLT